MGAAKRAWLVGLVLALAAACRTKTAGLVDEQNERFMPPDAGFRDAAPATCSAPPEGKKPDGSKCACTDECDSGFCVDGVCCNTACEETCKACNVPGSPGVCSFVPAGVQPAVEGQCRIDEPSSCGQDGTCDGAGGCRRYPDGTACGKGRCQGNSVVGGATCAGGTCQEGGAVPCAPYACDSSTGACFASCRSDGQCDGHACSDGMCGVKPLGAACKKDGECASGACADGVCCNLACDGACMACDQPGKMGQCTPVPAGGYDPHKVCKREAPESCGQDGRCNGAGGCTKQPAGTICQEGSCANGTQVAASVCDGMGACQPGASVSCAPFTCAGAICQSRCTKDADCLPGNVCAGGSCGRKENGRACKSNGECRSDFCVDGVCCESACGDACAYCAFPTSPGRCVSVPADQPDPRGQCMDRGAAACATNGRCNGNRACATYPDGTICKGQTCDPASNAVTMAGVCRGGACSVPPPLGCAPYKCGGTACTISCGNDADCSSPNSCKDRSCGRKGVGATCTRADECGSGFCAQGVCCASACNAACMSCALPGAIGQCTAVPAGGADPAGVCRDQGARSCGNDGTCNGAGGCHQYAPGTVCAPGSCASGSQRDPSTCNGGGICVPGMTHTCAPYACNPTTGACFGSCSTDKQCVAPTRCDATGHCGTKPNGAACADRSECQSGFCVEGVCCNSGCGTLCRSCTVAGAVGTCSDVPNGGVDPRGGCAPSAQQSCGNDGACNGAGACRRWAAGTPCRSGSCSADGASAVAAAVCDGNGTCPAGAVTPCGMGLTCRAGACQSPPP